MSLLNTAWHMEVINNKWQQHRGLKVQLAGQHLSFWKIHYCPTPAKADPSLSCASDSYTQVGRHPDKAMSVETCVTSQASVRCRHLFRLTLLKIAARYILVYGISTCQGSQGSNHTKPTTWHIAGATGLAAEPWPLCVQLCREQRWNSERPEPAVLC